MGRLQCAFPGPVTGIREATMNDPIFLEELTKFLSYMRDTSVDDAQAKSNKAGSLLTEIRDVANSKYITAMLTAVLAGQGCQTIPSQAIRKHVRDEVNWHRTLCCWRRLPYWLVLRVCLQTSLKHQTYKNIMLHLLANVLDLGLRANMESDILLTMSKKISRRAYKLGDMLNKLEFTKYCKPILRKCEMMLANRWKNAKSSSSLIVPAMNSVSLKCDTTLSLSSCNHYLTARSQAFHQPETQSVMSYSPADNKRGKQPEALLNLSSYQNHMESELATIIVDFENWVRDDAMAWSDRINKAETIKTLSECIPLYFQICTREDNIKQRPYCSSAMCLTILEMWILIDKATCAMYPLLREYSTEVPVDILKPILTLCRRDLARIHAVEKYLEARYKSITRPELPSVFSGRAAKNAFSTRYYESSQELQQLEARIIAKAEKDRQSKHEELTRMNASHAELMQKYNDTSCSYGINRRGCFFHHNHCQRCAYKKNADKLRIKVHEWPLPAEKIEFCMVVFELNLPLSYGRWRDATHYLLQSICYTNSSQSGRVEDYKLSNYQGLSCYFQSTSQSLTLSSKTKSFSQSHYSASQTLPASETGVLLNHAGSWELFDTKASRWISQQRLGGKLDRFSEYQTTRPAYRNLLFAVNGTTHTANDVAAWQHKCHQDLTLHEYEAFSLLRSGHRLQWRNILYELRKGCLNFKEHPVRNLILFATSQAGPRCSDYLRQSHKDLENIDLVRSLLDAINDILRKIADNTQEIGTVECLIIVAQRLLFAGFKQLEVPILTFLLNAHKITFKWLHRIQKDYEEADGDSKLTFYRPMLFEVAVVCRMTYDLDKDYFERIFNNTDHLKVYLYCGTLVYNHCLGLTRSLSTELQRFLSIHRRLSIRLEQHVHSIIHRDPNCLNLILSSIWETYDASEPWVQLTGQKSEWWQQTCTYGGSLSMIIHVSMLDNRILVNGQPFGRLPENVVSHGLYKLILGNVRVLSLCVVSWQLICTSKYSM